MARGSVRGRLLMKQIEKTLASDERYVLLIIKAPPDGTVPHIEAVSDISELDTMRFCLTKAAESLGDVPESAIHNYRGPRGGDLVQE